MSTLEGIFEQGHLLARARDPATHVMLVEESADRPAGYYYVSEAEIEAAPVAQEIAFRNLGRRVSLKDMLAWGDLAWLPATDHCWCEACRGARQLRGTLID